MGEWLSDGRAPRSYVLAAGAALALSIVTMRAPQGLELA